MALSLQQDFAANGKRKRLRPEDFDCVVLAYSPPAAWSTRALANSFRKRLRPEGNFVVDLREDVVDLREDRLQEPAAPAEPGVPEVPEGPAAPAAPAIIEVPAAPKPLKKKQRVYAEEGDINAWLGMVRNAFWAIQPPHPRMLEFFYFGKWALKSAIGAPRRGLDKNLQLLMEWSPDCYSGKPRPTTFLTDVQLHHMHDCCKACYNMIALQDLQLRKRRDERWGIKS